MVLRLRQRSRRPRRGCSLIESISYHNSRPRHRLEGLPQTFNLGIDFIRRSEIKNEHMVVPAVDRLLKPACQLRAPLRAEPALENGELQPTSITLHQLEHTTPTPVVADVIGDDV